MSFTELGLAEPILRAVREQGYTSPTPIQAQAIPSVMSGRDVLAAAQTGTGKTAGFTLPLLHRLATTPRTGKKAVRALVLTPTRELAAQVAQSIKTYGAHVDLRSAVVFGGVGINPQIETLHRGVDILIATPGRLLDLANQGAVNFSNVEILVLDEADRMLDMGFIHDIKKILAKLPAKRQNLLFSATFSNDIRNLTKGLLNNPITVEVCPQNTTAERIAQRVHPVDKSAKGSLLCHLIKRDKWEQVLVFTRTKHGANRLAEKLIREKITAAAIHGNKSQGARTKALSDFKCGVVQVLVATDIAARGLDIEKLPFVVNYELPNVPEDYVHRIGRTGRAGAEGLAVSLVSGDERKLLIDIEKLIKQNLTKEIVIGFEPGLHPEVKEVEAPRPPRQPRPQARRPNKPAGSKTGHAPNGHARPNSNRTNKPR